MDLNKRYAKDFENALKAYISQDKVSSKCEIEADTRYIRSRIRLFHKKNTLARKKEIIVLHLEVSYYDSDTDRISPKGIEKRILIQKATVGEQAHTNQSQGFFLNQNYSQINLRYRKELENTLRVRNIALQRVTKSK